MTSREQLELAALAIGFGRPGNPENLFCWTESEYPKGSGKQGALWNYRGWGDTAELWNPDTSQADSDMLGAALEMSVRWGRGYVHVEAEAHGLNYTVAKEPHIATTEDKARALRVARLKVAAEIGRLVKEQGA